MMAIKHEFIPGEALERILAQLAAGAQQVEPLLKEYRDACIVWDWVWLGTTALVAAIVVACWWGVHGFLKQPDANRVACYRAFRILLGLAVANLAVVGYLIHDLWMWHHAPLVQYAQYLSQLVK